MNQKYSFEYFWQDFIFIKYVYKSAERLLLRYYCVIFYNREVGNSWALEEAKRNLQRHYFLVGVTEELNDFVEVLENVLPRFFKGAYNFFLHSK